MLLFVCVLALSSCSRRSTDERKVRGVIKDAVAAARAKDAPGLLKHLAKDYNDNAGNDRDSIKALLLAEFIKPGDIGVFVVSEDVRVQGRVALVEAGVVLARGRAVRSIRDVVPEEADGFRFAVVLRRDEGGWKVISADWEHTGAAGLL